MSQNRGPQNGYIYIYTCIFDFPSNQPENGALKKDTATHHFVGPKSTNPDQFEAGCLLAGTPPFGLGLQGQQKGTAIGRNPCFWLIFSSGGPRPAINCFHTYTPPYIFFHLPSSTLICFHHFSTFLSVHLIHFFIIIFPKFSPSFSPFSSPHSFHHIPLKMSFPQSPHLIHFKKINFAKYIAKNICHQKNIRTV